MTSAGPAASAQPRKKGRRSPEEILGAVIMGLLLLITLANVIVRYLTSQSLAWTEELSIFLLVALTLAGAATAAAQNAHIRIEFFYDGASPRMRRIFFWLTTLATVLLFCVLAVLLTRTALQEFEYGETTPGLGLPRWWYTSILALLAVPVAIRAVLAHRRTSGVAGISSSDTSS